MILNFLISGDLNAWHMIIFLSCAVLPSSALRYGSLKYKGPYDPKQGQVKEPASNTLMNFIFP